MSLMSFDSATGVAGGSSGGGIFGGLSTPAGFSAASAGVGDIFKGLGSFAEAKDYNEARDISYQDTNLARESMAIQEAQEQRKLFTVTGQQAAAAGGGNLASGGSMGDILRSSIQQGALQHQLIAAQGNINVNNFYQQAQAYAGMSKAANNAGVSGIISGIAGIAGGFLGL